MSGRSKTATRSIFTRLSLILVALLLAQLCVGLAVLPARASAATAYQWYLAEGYTGPGFQEYLCIGNSGGTAAQASISFLFNGGSSKQISCTVQGRSRATVDVNATIGQGKEAGIKVTSSSSGLAVERSMYFVYQGDRVGSHTVRAANAPSRSWNFAEGYTGPGFDEYVCVLNPADVAASLTFHFQTPGGEQLKRGSVPARSRATFKVNDMLGAGVESSLSLASDQPVVAERSTYFDYVGTASNDWRGGHCVMGSPSLGSSYYFAEGNTRQGFEEWVTIQNPNARAITVSATYQFASGQGPPVTKSYQVGPSRRSTVYVPTEVGTGKDVSVRLSSSARFLAERPMYYSFANGDTTFTGGNCAIGAAAPAGQYFFAEGYTGPHFEEWLCIQNASGQASTVSIDYFTQEKGALPARTVSIAGNSRATVLVNESAGADLSLATRLTVKSGAPVLVERPLYVDDAGNPARNVNPVDPPAPTPTPTPTPTPAPTPTPTPAPPGINVMHGMCFSPYLTSWTVTTSELSSLLDKVKPYCEWIRTFGSESDWDTMLTLARSKGLHVAAGADIWNDLSYNQGEVNALIAQVKKGEVEQAVVGDEVVENNALTQDQMVSYLQQVKAAGAPAVSTSQTWIEWLQTPRIVAACDFLTVNLYPYWDEVSIDQAISDVDTQYRKVQAIAGGKKIILETGWPTAGNTNGQAVPSSANAAKFLKDFMAWASSNHVDYYYFESFDESWKDEGGCGAHWGLWTTGAMLKPEISAVLNPSAQ